MTNVVYWNIENFGINKVNNPSRKRPRYGEGGRCGGNLPAVAALQRRNHILTILRATQPDIFVLIEVSASATGAGDLAPATGGLQGAIFLLQQLRNDPTDPNRDAWRMVPPLKVGTGGRTESVAVLYRGISGTAGTPTEVRRYFTGPNVWTGGGVSAVAAGAVPAAYPAGGGGAPNIQDLLNPQGQPARTIPAGAQYNGGLAEGMAAARIAFAPALAPAAPPVVGGLVNFNGLRQPFMVSFVETNQANVITRNLTLFAVHAPPNHGGATNFINILLRGLLDVVAAPAGAPHNEIKLICGDFNLNAIYAQPPGAGGRTTAYDQLRTINYVPLLNPPPAMPVAPNLTLDAYQGYLATHIRPKRTKQQLTQQSRFLWSDNTAGGPLLAAPYPGYNYIGSDMVSNFFSIDNMLVNPLVPANNYQFTVMNPVSGTPFTVAGAMPAGVPIGTRPLAAQFTNVPAGMAWPQSPAAVYAVGQARTLNGWANYGYLRSTSDHLALFAVL